MRILIYSRAFAPSIGGLEGTMQLFAEGAVARGHDIRVVTATPGGPAAAGSFAIHRNPSWATLKSDFGWADIVLLGGMSLRGLLLSFVFRTPAVVSHQTMLTVEGWRGAGRAALKTSLTRLTRNISASRAIANALPGPSRIIPNPYDNDVFRTLPAVARNDDLIFVGRLVSDKGAAGLLRAVRMVADEGIRFTLTIVGDGPERPVLESLVDSLGLRGQVSFAGRRSPEEICRMLNAHRVLVVPSLWEEPFGIVALEGIACGCYVVATRGGGLPEAVGECGEFFPNGDDAALAAILRRLDLHHDWSPPESLVAERHLQKFRKPAFVRDYLSFLGEACGAS